MYIYISYRYIQFLLFLLLDKLLWVGQGTPIPGYNIQRRGAWGFIRWTNEVSWQSGGEDSIGAIEGHWTRLDTATDLQHQIALGIGFQSWNKLARWRQPAATWLKKRKDRTWCVSKAESFSVWQFDSMLDSINVFWYVSFIYVITQETHVLIRFNSCNQINQTPFSRPLTSKLCSLAERRSTGVSHPAASASARNWGSRKLRNQPVAAVVRLCCPLLFVKSILKSDASRRKSGG